MKMNDTYEGGYSYTFSFENHTGVRGIVTGTTIQMLARNQSGKVYDSIISYYLDHEPGWYHCNGHEMNTPSGQWQWFNYSVPLSGWDDIDRFQWMYGTGETTSGNAYLEFDCVRLKIDVIYELHEIAVTNVSSSKTVVGRGYTVNMSVAFANQGDFLESFNITAQANATIFDSRIVQLASHSSGGINMVWSTADWNIGSYGV
jgi:hypothetical protein